VNNAISVCDLYAEVLGVVCQSRFAMVRRKFTADLNILRHEKHDNMTVTVQNIINVLMGMQFYRIKTNNVEDLEMGIGFLHELGSYFLELKDRDYMPIKHHIAGVLVEILMPVASVRYMFH
jgi:hypothetical protein